MQQQTALAMSLGVFISEPKIAFRRESSQAVKFGWVPLGDLARALTHLQQALNESRKRLRA
jgi:hypothetical protein